MGHNLEQLGTASLDTFGGLITFANPQDLPEGASPRTWDTDFLVGSVFTRYGLSSVYTYASSLAITALTIGSGHVGTFTFSGGIPVVNEGFVLQGFSGSTQFLNGQDVFVISVNLISGTFVADVTGPAGTYTLLTGMGVSTVGQFLGPNVPTFAVSVAASGGNAWANPLNILGNLAYASVSSGTSANVQQIPTSAGSLPVGGTDPWNNAGNITSSSLVSFITLTHGHTQDPIIAFQGTLAIPTDAIVTGVQVAVKAFSSVFGVGSLNVQLADGNTLSTFGTAVNIPLSTTNAPYTAGSSTYQWGLTLGRKLVPADFNGNSIAVQVSAVVSSGTATITANNLVITVFYQLAGSSQVLQTTGYSFSSPATAGITGFGTTFQAYTSASSVVTMQLLKNGIAVGTPKVQVLTTTPTIYTLGAANDMWGSTWLSSDVNNVNFGVQITSSGLGTTFINDLDLLTYITPALVNFNYVKSYIQNNGQIDTLALDASGLLWKEDVTNNEYIMFSDLAIGTERPRVYFRGQEYLPLSQGGPGAPPQLVASQAAAGGTLVVTAYSVTSNVVTFTFTAQGAFVPVPLSLYLIAGVSPLFNGQTFTLLGAPAPTTTQFSAAFTHADIALVSGLNGTATPAFSYGVQSITQNGVKLYPQLSPVSFNGQELLQSSGPGQTTPGNVYTFYYGGANVPENASLLASLNSGNAVYVYIQGAPFGNGTQLVVGHNTQNPPNEHSPVPYFTTIAPNSAYQRVGGPSITGNTGTFQQTLATLTTSSPIPDLAPGDALVIEGVTPTAWNNSWTVIDSLNSGVLNVTSTQMTSGVASYGFNVQSGIAPLAGEIVTVTNANNNAIFNTTGVIAAVIGPVFTIDGFSSPDIPFANEATASAITFGTQFTFDPGASVVGTNNPSIFENAGPGGSVVIVGGVFTPIGAGTRQAVVFFITKSGYETTPSPPVTFTTSSDANFITASQIPIGPPDTVARGIAFTEAGQNGVPGANFYVIETPFVTVVNGQSRTYDSTIIHNNTDTTAKFTFTDAVLLNSREIDIQGDDLFNLIELGSSAWAVPYVGRMFYGLQLNKIDNWTSGGSLSFDGGYLPNPGGNIQPLGWNVANTADQTLITSVVTGQSLYIKNTNPGTMSVTGLVYQTAFQDPYGVAIIQPNVTYSVRVTASIPSGLTGGVLIVDLTDLNQGSGFGNTYGSFALPLSSMTTNEAVFIGTLLTIPFLNQTSPNVQIRVYVQNMQSGADVAIDRIEVFPTLTPYLKAQVYGSYTNQPEAIDASGTGGILDTTSENAQACMGGFVMHNLLYLLKTNSWYSTQDNPNSEPGGWGLSEVSNKVGAIGINSYDTGEEWAITACRAGIYGFNGGQPVKISLELWNLWECINWAAGNTIVVRNDIVNKRIFCAIPLPTGVNPITRVPTKTLQWLPNAPYNPAPTSPNVMLMLNYQGMATFEELVNSPELHTTMFGALAAVDMKRKWSIWQIPTPAMDFIMRQDQESTPLFICNGIKSSKIYQLLQEQLSDDGVPINSLYTTYGFVNAAKAATLPIFGFHTKRYSVFQCAITGGQTDTTSNGRAKVRMLQNTLSPRYPYTVPVGIPLSDPVQDDFFRPINVRGNRMFAEVSSNAVGSWFNLSKMLLTGKADAWSALNPTGGGNTGVI